MGRKRKKDQYPWASTSIQFIPVLNLIFWEWLSPVFYALSSSPDRKAIYTWQALKLSCPGTNIYPKIHSKDNRKEYDSTFTFSIYKYALKTCGFLLHFIEAEDTFKFKKFITLSTAINWFLVLHIHFSLTSFVSWGHHYEPSSFSEFLISQHSPII